MAQNVIMTKLVAFTTMPDAGHDTAVLQSPHGDDGEATVVHTRRLIAQKALVRNQVHKDHLLCPGNSFGVE